MPFASSDQPDTEWTQVSIPNLDHPSYSEPIPLSSSSDSLHLTRHRSSQVLNPTSPTDHDLLLERLVPDPHPNNQLGESDSSTHFDVQAWKRGDRGTGRRRINPRPAAAADQPLCLLEEAAFMPVPVAKPARRRRSASATGLTLLTNAPRPTSDVGPLSRAQHGRHDKPTWTAYAGREGRQVDGLEFLQALANLRAMARIGKPEWQSVSSRADDEDADEPRPKHADLPTSPFNSAAEDDEHDDRCEPRDGRNQDSDDLDEGRNHASGSKWWNRIEKAMSFKTIHLIGLGGIVFGIGIVAGSLISRRIQTITKFMDFIGSIRFNQPTH